MNLLAIDTSTALAGIALEFNGRRSSVTWQSAHNHGKELMPKLIALLDSAGCSASELDCVAVALGPGGFSAVRVGVSCAIGIASAGDITAVGIPTHYLQARAFISGHGIASSTDSKPCLGYGAEPPANLTSALPIGRNQFSLASYGLPLGAITASCSIEIGTADDLTLRVNEGRTTVCGEGVPASARACAERHPRPPEVMLDIATESLDHELAGHWPIRPIYAREPTISRPKHGVIR